MKGFPVGGALLRTNSFPVLTVQRIRVCAEPEDPITIILDTGRHMLEGWVINGFGMPVAASTITLDWEFRDNGLRNSSARQTTADQNGNFVFTDLGPDLTLAPAGIAGVYGDGHWGVR